MEVTNMAQYDYQCQKCARKFTIEESFGEHDKHKAVKCPKCGSADVQQQYSNVHVKTSRKS